MGMRKMSMLFLIGFMTLSYLSVYVCQGHAVLGLAMNVFIFPNLAAIAGLIWMLPSCRKSEERKQVFWRLLCAGQLSFLLAQNIWFYLLLTTKTMPYPSLADYFWLAQYSFSLIALLMKSGLFRTGSNYVQFLLRIAIFMTIALTFSLQYLIEPVLRSSFATRDAFAVSLAYPLFDLTLLFATVCMGMMAMRSRDRAWLYFIAGGFFLQILADTAHSLLLASGRYVPGGWVDPLWEMPMLLYGFAAMTARRMPSGVGEEKQPSEQGINTHYSLVNAAGIFLLLWFALYANHHTTVWFDSGIMLVFGLLIVRQIMIMRDNRRLLKWAMAKNAELEASKDRYRRLIEMSPNAISIIADTKFIYVNRFGMELFGATRNEDLLGRSVFEIIPSEHHDTIKARHLKAELMGQTSERYEYPIQRLDGRIIYIESTMSSVDFDGIQAFMSFAQDITSRKMDEDRIKALAYFDPLTGLANRASFYNRLQEGVASGNRNSGSPCLAVMYLDLDRFKMINDTFGHQFGDKFLVSVANELSRAVGGEGNLYRLGGDEFCLIQAIGDKAEAASMAQRILDAFSQPLVLEGRECYTTPSIGVSLCPADGADADTLIKHADIAMYTAKREGGNACHFFTAAMDEAQCRITEIEDQIRTALRKEEFVLHYQPKFNLETKEIIGVEALIRWQNPFRGLLEPKAFIPVAEDSGLIIPISQWVLKEACRQMKQWQAEGLPLQTMAVNISPCHFLDKNFAAFVQATLEEAGLDPCNLDIEITENLIHDKQQASEILKKVKALGVKIAIDDFGTGYSSFSHLKQLPIDCLKVDKTFIDDLGRSPRDEAIVRAIIEMGRHLGFQIIAEGLEDEAQLRALIRSGCQFGQGYLFSKPLPAPELQEFSCRYRKKLG